jgi:hypothetical protein
LEKIVFRKQQFVFLLFRDNKMEWDHFGALGGNKVFLRIKKNSPRNSWAGVALVWYSKRVLFFEGAEGNFNRSTHNRWVLPCSRNILQGIGIEGHQQVG